MQRILICLLLTVFIASCTTIDVYQKTFFFSSHEWKGNDTPSFTFTIKDNSHLYNLYAVIRHGDAYRYKNIWLNVQVKTPDSVYTLKREFILADNTKWLGSAMDDIIEHRLLFNSIPILLKKGNYTFTLQQVMREEPLQYMLDAGIRVEKANP